MLTDAPPRKVNRSEFSQSDRLRSLELPQDQALLSITRRIEAAMQSGSSPDVRRSCSEFLETASDFYKVPNCGCRVLAARPPSTTIRVARLQSVCSGRRFRAADGELTGRVQIEAHEVAAHPAWIFVPVLHSARIFFHGSPRLCT